MCQEGPTRPSQHRGLHDDLRVLDVPFALDHPELQLGWAGLLPFPSLGYGADTALATGGRSRRRGRLESQLRRVLHATAHHPQVQGDSRGHGNPVYSWRSVTNLNTVK